MRNEQVAMSPGHGCAARGAAHLLMVEGQRAKRAPLLKIPPPTGPRPSPGNNAAHRPSAFSISATAAAQASVSGAISSTWPVRSIMRTSTVSPLARIGAA